MRHLSEAKPLGLGDSGLRSQASHSKGLRWAESRKTSLRTTLTLWICHPHPCFCTQQISNPLNRSFSITLPKTQPLLPVDLRPEAAFLHWAPHLPTVSPRLPHRAPGMRRQRLFIVQQLPCFHVFLNKGLKQGVICVISNVLNIAHPFLCKYL